MFQSQLGSKLGLGMRMCHNNYMDEVNPLNVWRGGFSMVGLYVWLVCTWIESGPVLIMSWICLWNVLITIIISAGAVQ